MIKIVKIKPAKIYFAIQTVEICIKCLHESKHCTKKYLEKVTTKIVTNYISNIDSGDLRGVTRVGTWSQPPPPIRRPAILSPPLFLNTGKKLDCSLIWNLHRMYQSIHSSKSANFMKKKWLIFC